MTPKNSKKAGYAFTALAGLGVLGTLAGCSSTATAGDGSSDSSSSLSSTPVPSVTSTAPAAEGSSAASTGSYTDGSYSASGSYQTPNGTEEIDVTITLAGDLVAAVDITSNPSNPNTKEYQGEFIDGIEAIVVGKKIDELAVTKVAGSSLTSGGFNKALESIASQAAA